MKRKISISIEENTLKDLDEMLENRVYRNKSHLIELAINKFMEDKND